MIDSMRTFFRKERDNTVGNKISDDAILHMVKMLSLSYLLIGVGCLATGCLTLKYAAPDHGVPNIQFPYSTGSGLWTGILTVIIAGVGGVLCRRYDSQKPAATKCLVITLYTLVIIDITCGTLHVIYSALGMRKCYADIRTGHMSCNPEERPRILLTGGFNAAFGIIIAILSIVFTIYISLRQRLHINRTGNQ